VISVEGWIRPYTSSGKVGDDDDDLATAILNKWQGAI